MKTKRTFFQIILVSILSGCLFQQANATVKVWGGTFSPVYTYCGNWRGGACPADTDNVEIPTGSFFFYPSISAGITVRCHNLNLKDDSMHLKSSLPGSPIIGGNFEVLGNLIIEGDLTIHFPTSLTVRSGATLTVLGTTTIISPTGVDNSRLIIENNGSFISGCNVTYLPYNSSPYHGTGYPLVYRTIPQDLKWHLLSSPVLTQPIANKDFAPLANNFPLVPNTAWDFYKWLSTCPDPPYNDNWRNLRNTDGTQNYMDFGYPSYFESGKGYLVAYSNWHQNNAVFYNNPTKAFYGPLNSCCEGFDFHNALTICPYFWELIGNPFTSAIDWRLVTEKYNLVSDYYFIYNDHKTGGAGYEYWSDSLHHSGGTDGYIPSTQGFFVQVLTDGGRFIGLPLTARKHHNVTDTWLKESNSSSLKLTLGNGTNYDETVIMFEANGETGRDRNDAEKMFSLDTEVPQVYTITDNSFKTALNSLPFTENPVTVKIGYLAPALGTYTLTITGAEQFNALTGMILEDLETSTSQNMILNPVYHFNSNANEYADRFLLHLTGPIGTDDKDMEHTLTIYSSGHTVYISSPSAMHNAQVSITNLLGQEILSRKLEDQALNQVSFNGHEGYYIVKVQDNSSVRTAKIFIK